MEKIKYPPIILPYSPESINSVIVYGKNKTDLVDFKKRWQDIAAIYITEAIQEGQLPDKLVGKALFHFKMFFDSHRRRDEDNYFLISKAIIDEFVHQDVIEDDSSEFSHFAGSWLLYDKDRPRIEIFLTEYIDEKKLVKIEFNELNKSNRFNSFQSEDFARKMRSAFFCDTNSQNIGIAESVEAIEQSDCGEIQSYENEIDPA